MSSAGQRHPVYGLVVTATKAAVVVALGLLPLQAIAGERVDLFDTAGRRTGYATFDRQTGRVDLYGVDGKRQGYGQRSPVAPDTLELFDLKGRRQGSAVLPPAPERPK